MEIVQVFYNTFNGKNKDEWEYKLEISWLS